MLDVYENCRYENIEGYMVVFDFMKAFDSVDGSFMVKALKILNFGEKNDNNDV